MKKKKKLQLQHCFTLCSLAVGYVLCATSACALGSAVSRAASCILVLRQEPSSLGRAASVLGDVYHSCTVCIIVSLQMSDTPHMGAA